MPYIATSETRIHYRDAGQGPVALFLHGFPLDSRMWIDQIERLGDVRRCVAPDLRGFGQSDPIAHFVLSMERHAHDIAALIDRLGETDVDVVGFSMGGYVALALAELYPEVVRSLILVDTTAASDTGLGRAGRDAAKEKVMTRGRRVLAEGLVDALIAQQSSDIVRARVHTMIESTPYETIIASLEGMKERRDRTSVLRQLMVPVRVIVGEQDALTPPAVASQMAEDAQDSRYWVIDGVGHMAPMEHPDAVAEVLREVFEATAPPARHVR